MAKHPAKAKSAWPMIGYSALVIMMITILVATLRPNHARAPTGATLDRSNVTITAADGIHLAATIKFPGRSSLSPAVVLLHEYGQDRHQWDAYLQPFLDSGLAVLSYDMRGFGDSRLTAIPADRDAHLASLAKDLPDVITYLKQQSSIDPARISIAGAGIGADVAYLGIGSGLGFHRAVLLSPSVNGTVFDGHDIQNFSAAGVLGISSDTDQSDLNTFMAAVHDPQDKKIISGAGRGITLLANEAVINDLIAWVKE